MFKCSKVSFPRYGTTPSASHLGLPPGPPTHPALAAHSFQVCSYYHDHHHNCNHHGHHHHHDNHHHCHHHHNPQSLKFFSFQPRDIMTEDKKPGDASHLLLHGGDEHDDIDIDDDDDGDDGDSDDDDYD